MVCARLLPHTLNTIETTSFSGGSKILRNGCIYANQKKFPRSFFLQGLEEGIVCTPPLPLPHIHTHTSPPCPLNTTRRQRLDILYLKNHGFQHYRYCRGFLVYLEFFPQYFSIHSYIKCTALFTRKLSLASKQKDINTLDRMKSLP